MTLIASMVVLTLILWISPFLEFLPQVNKRESFFFESNSKLKKKPRLPLAQL